MPVRGFNDRGRRFGLGVGGREACMADYRRESLRVDVSVCQRDRRWDEQINGEGHREVLRVSEGEEGVMGEVRVGVRQPTPEAKGTTANTAIEHARAASGSSGETMVEREEAKGCNHCRGGPLGMWVASYIQAIQVKEVGRRVSEVIVKVASGCLAERDGGRREAAIIEA